MEGSNTNASPPNSSAPTTSAVPPNAPATVQAPQPPPASTEQKFVKPRFEPFNEAQAPSNVEVASSRPTQEKRPSLIVPPSKGPYTSKRVFKASSIVHLRCSASALGHHNWRRGRRQDLSQLSVLQRSFPGADRSNHRRGLPRALTSHRFGTHQGQSCFRWMHAPSSILQVQLWDTAGQERYRQSIVAHYYRNVNAVVFVYDVTNPSSFKSLPSWIEECRKHSLTSGDNTPHILIGTYIAVVMLCCKRLRHFNEDSFR